MEGTVLDTHHTWRNGMAGGGKRKTTMAKLTRERRLQERRLDKQARKEARKQAAANPPAEPSDWMSGNPDEADGPSAGEPGLSPALHTLSDD